MTSYAHVVLDEQQLSILAALIRERLAERERVLQELLDERQPAALVQVAQAAVFTWRTILVECSNAAVRLASERQEREIIDTFARRERCSASRADSSRQDREAALTLERDHFQRWCLCDACGDGYNAVVKHVTDDEVCGGTDGPGFYLCGEAKCEASDWWDGNGACSLSVEGRRAFYTAQRAENDERRRVQREHARTQAKDEE
jgi:hypothetical protein